MKKLYVVLLVLFSFQLDYAQEKIEKLDWLTGTWGMEKWGGEMEEWWSSPAGNVIIGAFVFTIEDTVNFTEHFEIIENNGQLTMKLKHFDSSFSGWEEKDKYIEFPFVEMGDNYIKFEDMLYERVDENTLRAVVNIEEDGRSAEEEFLYTRKK